MRTSKHRQRTSKEILDNGKVIPYAWYDEINIKKMSVLPKVIYRLKVIHIEIHQNSKAIIQRTRNKKGKPIQVSTCNYRRPQMAKGILRRKRQLEVLCLWLQIVLRTTVINADYKLGKEANGTEHRNQQRCQKYAAEKRQHIQKNRDGRIGHLPVESSDPFCFSGMKIS